MYAVKTDYKEEDNKMDFVAQILAMVEELLAYLGEFEAAGILDIIENFFAGFMA